ncbi:MAG TPA: nicotinate-nucleotide adenylyltransferase [Vicinamibacteria bacterium]|nr:nicotinate-nucleotide adenylyltransferase [Vicinamibacteria bacterium]
MSHKRWGVLGGTFDPIHFGHLRAAESVREAMALDRIVFVPSRVPPHKARPSVTSAEDRYLMVEAAVSLQPTFEVSRIEIERQAPSYTIDTLAQLAGQDPEREVFFITGIDAFREIRTWRQWEELLRTYSFIVHGRPGYGLAGAFEVVPEELRSRLVEIRNGAPPSSERGPSIYLVNALTLNISATEIRAFVRAGRSIRYLVPPEVESYIAEHRLYKEKAG